MMVFLLFRFKRINILEKTLDGFIITRAMLPVPPNAATGGKFGILLTTLGQWMSTLKSNVDNTDESKMHHPF